MGTLRPVRKIWSGSVVLGQVTIPVGLATTHASGDVSFRSLHKDCGTPLSQKRWCSLHDREVPEDEIVKGWEVTKGQYVALDPDELAALTPDGEAHRIDVFNTVDVDQLEPLGFAKSYYLAPADSAVGRRPYALLAEALTDSECAALARFVAWGAEHVCAIRPLGRGRRALVLHVLHEREDAHPPDAIEDLLADLELPGPALDLAGKLVEALYVRIDKADLTTPHRGRVAELLDAKLAGGEIVQPPSQLEPIPTVPVDLEAALKRSLTEIRKTRPRSRAKPAAKR